MRFKLNIAPPTATAQMKKVRVVHGRPMFYEPANVKEAKSVLYGALLEHKPSAPFDGAVWIAVDWMFGTKDKKKVGSWRTTRPDTDNLQKMLKDVMTELGYWHDDSQVVSETINKSWTTIEEQGIDIKIMELPKWRE